MKRIALLMLGTATLWSACQSDVDETAPTLELVSMTPAAGTGEICGEMEDHVIEIQTGQSIEMSLRFTDNEELSQYKIDIHDNFDCHDHGKSLAPWSVLETVDLTGTEQTVEKTLTVPTDVRAGNYHFDIKLLDAAGNEAATELEYAIKVSNSSDLVAPTIQLNVPTTDVTVAGGGNVSIEVMVSDNMDLAGGEMELLYEVNEQDLELLHEEFDAGTGTSTTITHSFNAPTEAGTYPVEILLYDAVGNLTELDAFNIIVQ